MHPEPQHLKYFARKNQCSRGKKVRKAALNKRYPWPGFTRLNATTLARHRIRTIGHHMFFFAYCSRTSISSSLAECCAAPLEAISVAIPLHHVVQGCLQPFAPDSAIVLKSVESRTSALVHIKPQKCQNQKRFLASRRDWGAAD
jgi:hypothetical protein